MIIWRAVTIVIGTAALALADDTPDEHGRVSELIRRSEAGLPLAYKGIAHHGEREGVITGKWDLETEFAITPDWCSCFQRENQAGIGLVPFYVTRETVEETLVYEVSKKRGASTAARAREGSGPCERTLSPGPWLRLLNQQARDGRVAVMSEDASTIVLEDSKGDQVWTTRWTLDRPTSRLMVVQKIREGSATPGFEIRFDEWQTVIGGEPQSAVPTIVTTTALSPKTGQGSTVEVFYKLSKLSAIDALTPPPPRALPEDAIVTDILTGRIFNGVGEELPQTPVVSSSPRNDPTSAYVLGAGGVLALAAAGAVYQRRRVNRGVK